MSAATKQFQVVITRLTGKSRADEEALTDLLNERARGGWLLHSSTAIDTAKLMLVFARQA